MGAMGNMVCARDGADDPPIPPLAGRELEKMQLYALLACTIFNGGRLRAVVPVPCRRPLRLQVLR